MKNNEKWDGELSHLSVFGWAVLFSCPVFRKMLAWPCPWQCLTVQEMRVPSVGNPELTNDVLPLILEPGVGQNLESRSCMLCQGQKFRSCPRFYCPGPFTFIFFSKSSPYFSNDVLPLILGPGAGQNLESRSCMLCHGWKFLPCPKFYHPGSFTFIYFLNHLPTFQMMFSL